MSERVFDNSIELKGNALLKVRPELFYEWVFEKNDVLGLDIYKVTKGQNIKAWWKCNVCKCPPYEAIINNKTSSRKRNGSNCPYCSKYNPKLLKGFNDMWTTNPTLARMLLNPEDGHKYTQGSDKKVDWKCLECDNIIKNKKINVIYSRGLSCPKCSDGISFPEKFMYNLLKEVDIEFVFDEAQVWSDSKRYDFYLPDYNWIIEMDGEQHSKETGYAKMGGRTLKEEQENDRLKERLAKENGISKYIVIDCRHSTIEWMRRNILNSDLYKLLSDVDFGEIGRLASSSLLKEVCSIWNSGNNNTLEIGKIVKLNRTTIVKYLKRGAEIGWCDYTVAFAHEHRINKSGVSRRKPVIQLGIEQKFIKEWEGAVEIQERLGLAAGGVSSACRGIGKTSGGFKWMYKEDYEKYLSGEIILAPLINQRAKEVVQLSLDMSFIAIFNSLVEASTSLGLGRQNISSVCRGKIKTTGDFRWMYKRDYEEYLSGNIEILPLISKLSMSVVQLDLGLNLIETYPSQTLAAKAVGLAGSTTISNVCTGKSKTAGGFKWMFKEDYEKLISAN